MYMEQIVRKHKRTVPLCLGLEEILAPKGSIVLKKGEGRLLKAGGAWIFDNEISGTSEGLSDGDMAAVEDFDGFLLGYGFFNSRSRIRVRMLSRYRKEPPDGEFLRGRAGAAWEYRKMIMGGDMGSCRVVFGEADWLPGLVVDKYEDVLVVESLSLGMDRVKEDVLAFLCEAMAKDGIRIRGIYERSDAPVCGKEGMEPRKGFLGDPFDTDVEITENGIRYLVDVAEGQKTGFFLDQKYNRLAVQRLVKGLAEGAGRDIRVLDCFTHMGTFALNAGIAGAGDVLGLDISEKAVAQAGDNAARNGLSGRVRFRRADVLEELPKMQSEGERYDLVILDPPAFTKSREATKRAVQGYREINRRGMALVREGGFLATCSCSHFMTEGLFIKTLQEAARAAKKRLRLVEQRSQSPDHPVLLNTSQFEAEENSRYLKFLIFQVVTEL